MGSPLAFLPLTSKSKILPDPASPAKLNFNCFISNNILSVSVAAGRFGSVGVPAPAPAVTSTGAIDKGSVDPPVVAAFAATPAVACAAAFAAACAAAFAAACVAAFAAACAAAFAAACAAAFAAACAANLAVSAFAVDVLLGGGAIGKGVPGAAAAAAGSSSKLPLFPNKPRRLLPVTAAASASASSAALAASFSSLAAAGLRFGPKAAAAAFRAFAFIPGVAPTTASAGVEVPVLDWEGGGGAAAAAAASPLRLVSFVFTPKSPNTLVGEGPTVFTGESAATGAGLPVEAGVAAVVAANLALVAAAVKAANTPGLVVELAWAAASLASAAMAAFSRNAMRAAAPATALGTLAA